MVGYLKANPKKNIFFNPQHLTIYYHLFTTHYWHNFYHDGKDDIQEDASTQRGNLVSTHFFVGADYAGNKSTRRSQTTVLIFLNKGSILWYSKQQNTVETSMFSRELIAFKKVNKLVEVIWYKL